MQKKVYAQLYSLVRTNREGHLEALEALSQIGYDGVELMGRNTGGLTEAEFAARLRDWKLEVISSHALRDETDFRFAAALGARYTDIRPDYANSSRDEVLRCCERLNEAGRVRAVYGLKAVIHNHAEEFWWVDDREGGVRIYDLLLENTDPALVGFEFDVGWGARAGVRPEAYITRYAGRFPLLHVKECNEAAKDRAGLEHFPKKVLELGPPKIINGTPYFSEEQKRMLDASRSWNVELGHGLLDWKAIVAAAEAQGCDGYINEREYYHLVSVPDSDPVACARQDYAFLRSL